MTYYITTHPDNFNKAGEPYFKNLTELFEEIGHDYTWYEVTSESRWYQNIFCVQEINDVLIGYNFAKASGDTSIWDMNWNFNEDSICFVEPKEVTITTYVKI